MRKAIVELDFLGLDRHTRANLPPLRGGIQGAMSRISPQLLRSVISSGPDLASPRPAPAPLSPRWAPLPLLNDASSSRPPVCESPRRHGTAPLTIFYNGTVVVSDLPHDKAEAIIQLAEGGSSVDRCCLLERFNMGDLPMARRKSLQHFLEKRKERLTAVAPYGCEVVGLSLTKKTNC